MHRTNLTGIDIVEVDDGIRITAPARTAWDVAALETVPAAVGVLDGMMRAGCLDLEALRRSHDRARGRRRATRVGKVLPLVDGVFLGRVDLAWTDARVIVEFEGAHHFEGVQITEDDERYRRLLAAGWVVIRLSAADLRDMSL